MPNPEISPEPSEGNSDVKDSREAFGLPETPDPITPDPGELHKPDKTPDGEPGEPGDKTPDPVKDPEGEKTPVAEIIKELEGTNFKSWPEVLKAQKEMESFHSKTVNDMKSTHESELKSATEKYEAVQAHLEKLKTGEVTVGSGADLLERMKIEEPKMAKHYDELFNTMGESAFEAMISLRLQDIEGRKQSQKEQDEKASAEKKVAEAVECYETMAKEKPELADPKVRAGITEISEQLFKTENFEDPNYAIQTFYDIYKGRQSNEEFAKAVKKTAETMADEIIAKKLAGGLLVSKSAAGSGGATGPDAKDESDKAFGVGKYATDAG